MLRTCAALLTAFTLFASGMKIKSSLAQESPAPLRLLRIHRSSPGELEVGGALAGLPANSTRYIRYEDLLTLPQETYTVSDDTNFHGATEIEGVPLAALAKLLGGTVADPMIVAICYDRYRTNYPQDYIAAHHPLLVLRINGQLRDHWPHSEYGGSMSPYVISHPTFKPSFKVLSHEDEPQIPYGVTRLEVRPESVVFGAIKPAGNWPAGSPVAQGYTIASQDCFRCHNMGAQGGVLAGQSWLQLAAIANRDPARFRAIIHDPAAVKPGARMPAHKDYDQATLSALTAYFKTFGSASATDRSRP